MTNSIDNIGVMGGGAWGLALASLYHRAGRTVTVLTKDPHTHNALANGTAHPRVLQGVTLPRLAASNDSGQLTDADLILVVVRAQSLRARLSEAATSIRPETVLTLCCKGVEADSLLTMHAIARQMCPNNPITVLSGPSFAQDVAQNLPTAVSLAGETIGLAEHVAQQLKTPVFRPYATDDIIGVEIGGSVKNVLALACGITEGLGLGSSAHAALLSRGFAEMSRLGLAMGARPVTLSGLSGLGDLVLTCGSTKSRNMRFGIALGQGGTKQAVSAEFNEVAEGVTTAPMIMRLAGKYNVDMPICSAVNHVLNGDITAQDAAANLLNRPLKSEG